MTLTYEPLLLGVLGAFIVPNRRIFLTILSLITLFSYFQGIVTEFGLMALAALSLGCYLFFHKQNSPFFKFVLFSVILLFCAALTLHLIPGFNNIPACQNVRVSALCTPYTMYFNFDKLMGALIVYASSDLFHRNSFMKRATILTKKKLILTSGLVVACVITLLVPGMLTGFIKIDISIPDIWFLWVINNLFFVCFSEEVIFRGFIYENLKKHMGFVKSYWIFLILSSAIFGAFHYAGGLVYVLLSTVAGLFYGYCYEKTGKIIYPILVHFGLNLTHFIFFTYPSAARLIP